MNVEKNLEVLKVDPNECHPDDLLEIYGMWIVDEMGRRGWIDLPKRIQNSAERRYIARARAMGVLQSYTDDEIMASVTWALHCLGIKVTPANVNKLYRDLQNA